MSGTFNNFTNILIHTLNFYLIFKVKCECTREKYWINCKYHDTDVQYRSTLFFIRLGMCQYYSIISWRKLQKLI